METISTELLKTHPLIESKPQRKPADQKEQNYAKTVLENAVQKIEKAPNGEAQLSLEAVRLIEAMPFQARNQEQACLTR